MGVCLCTYVTVYILVCVCVQSKGHLRWTSLAFLYLYFLSGSFSFYLDLTKLARHVDQQVPRDLPVPTSSELKLQVLFERYEL